MERNERCSQQIRCVFLSLLLSGSLQAGGIFSLCRKPVAIHPQPSPAQERKAPAIKERVHHKMFILKPIAATSLRRDRIKRHVKFMIKKRTSSGSQNSTS